MDLSNYLVSSYGLNRVFSRVKILHLSDNFKKFKGLNYHLKKFRAIISQEFKTTACRQKYEII